ncbi:hypothetical protein D9757_010440 [Collybiopsis confluens]|uniref:Uncharacterized protein n=1 Tax=Collybiopsis confluens TaxID=2823264 RepID=A0A8H5LTE4_9AGAR|nr:hypothetical protein D9757_010440 [Collybiopsis confluens]
MRIEILKQEFEFVVWGAGPALNQSQLTQWCQLRPEYNSKRLDDLGPFDYAFLMLEHERLVNPKAPALYSCFNQKTSQRRFSSSGLSLPPVLPHLQILNPPRRFEEPSGSGFIARN